MARVIQFGTASNRLLRLCLEMITGMVIVLVAYWIVTTTVFAVDLEIPMRAADRWTHGGEPYVAAAFLLGPGADLPFLYPPAVLPIVAPFLALPRVILWWAWAVLCLAVAIFTCRRLRVPWRAMPLVLAWPPFAEGLMTGNVQILLFAAFVTLFWRHDAEAPDWQPTPIDPGRPTGHGTRALREDVASGVRAAVIPALKIAQIHTWWYLLTRRPKAAFIGLAVVAIVALATLPITGIDLWSDWIAQVGRASDPHWAMAGISLAGFLPTIVSVGAIVGTLATMPFVRSTRPGVWVGLLAIVGAPSIHTYGLLFMLPAMLVIRREVALVAALLVTTSTEPSTWLGIVIVVLTTVASRRWPILAEPVAAMQPSTGQTQPGAVLSSAG